jgi:putative oxidoreductase
MKPSQPIGNAEYGPLFIRVALSAYFILAGLTKLKDPVGFMQEVQAMGLLPNKFALVFAIVLPYVEIAAGALCLIGFWTTLSACLLAAMLGSFIYAMGIKPTDLSPFNKDFILLAGALSLLYTGAGAMSIDRFRKSG